MEAIHSKKFSLKQIFKDHWSSFVKTHKTLVTWYIAYNVWKILNCREPDGLGYMTFACPVHPEQICHIPKSCKSRFCSVCAKVQIDKWVSDMNRLFPNCPYYHITFTVPSEFRTLLFEKKDLLDAVFSATTETLISFCKEQGFLPAITAVMHTFGSDLKRHIHIHCIISAGGLKLNQKQKRYTRYIKRKKGNGKIKKIKVVVDNPKWVSHSFFPYKMLHKRYQALLIEHLKKRITKNINSDNPDEDLLIFSNPDVLKAFFDDLKNEYSKGFYVNVSEERKDLKATVGYIGRYARRPPISEVRIKDYTGDYITFEYKDYYANGAKTLYTLKSFDFIEKLIRHIPPHYFNVIRHYGIIASRVKSKYKKLTNNLLGILKGIKKSQNWQQRQKQYRGEDPLICKTCNRPMSFVKSCTPIKSSHVKASFQRTFG